MPRPSRQLRDLLRRLPATLTKSRPPRGSLMTAPFGLLGTGAEKHPMRATDAKIAASSPPTAQNASPSEQAEPEQHLDIPVRMEAEADQQRSALRERGQFLARQDRWQDLSDALSTADQDTIPPGEMPPADLLAFGARADVVNAVEHALSDGSGRETRVLIDGIMSLEAIRTDHRHDPYLTALIALAHVDIGWLWRGSGPNAQPPKTDLRRAAAHFDRAATLVERFRHQSSNSAFLTAAACAVFTGQQTDTMNAADSYAHLIGLKPQDHRPMRALGMQMLPANGGSYSALELEARRTASLTQETWGAGGYAWVYFDAIVVDPMACARVDTAFFLDGLRDIVGICASQETTNLLTAYCALALPQSQPEDQTSAEQRQSITAATDWLIREHLREIHPLIWAHAAEGFNNNAKVSSLRRFAARGQADALRLIAKALHHEISAGQKAVFTPAGLQLEPSR